jgi:alpha-galactosidase
MGLYDFWDTLVAQNPGLKLDVCSGTGSRIDFEVMRRAMNLTRTDGAWWKPVPDQAKTLGHAPWTPHTGIGAVSDAPYDFRSGLGAMFCANFNYLSKNEVDWERWKKLLAQVKDLREVYCGDFYPLTGWSLAEEDMAAWQYSRPDLGKALVQVFRRSKAETPSEGYRIRPKGLDPKASYTVTDIDMPSQSSQISGDILMREGLEVSFPQKPQSALFLLQKK